MRLVEQVEENRFRPTMQLTPAGEEVMRGKAPLPGPLTADEFLLLRIKQGYKPAAKPAPIPDEPDPAATSGPRLDSAAESACEPHVDFTFEE